MKNFTLVWQNTASAKQEIITGNSSEKQILFLKFFMTKHNFSLIMVFTSFEDNMQR